MCVLFLSSDRESSDTFWVIHVKHQMAANYSTYSLHTTSIRSIGDKVQMEMKVTISSRSAVTTAKAINFPLPVVFAMANITILIHILV